MSERAFQCVPKPVLLLAGAALTAQIALHFVLPAPQARGQELPAPMKASVWRVAALGDVVATAKLLSLWLQAFDNQPGVSVAFNQLDYAKVAAWLGTSLQLDPLAQYPLFAAARVYAEVDDAPRQRAMLEFIDHEFQADPNRRWPYLAQAAVIAKHRLHDLPLALKYAREIADKTDSSAVPSWAKQMHIFLLEDMGELESARILLGGLLHSGAITDAHELRFLNERMQELERSTAAPRAPDR